MYRNTFPKAIRNDSNLLITLYLLLNIRQINSVAEELCISQSAVSQKLARLREVFNDQLLVRNRGEMLLTAFAEELLPKLETIIKHIEDVYSVISLHDTVRPTKSTYTICMYGDSHIAEAAIMIQTILNELSMEKEVSFEFIQRTENSIDDLRNANIDFYIGSLAQELPSISSLELQHHSYTFAVSKSHPLAGKTVEEEDLLEYQFIMPSGGEDIDILFKKTYPTISENAHPLFKLQSTHAIRKLISHSEMYSFLHLELIEQLNLACVHVRNKHVTLGSHLYWHNLLENDTFHEYMRKRIPELIAEQSELLP